VIEAISATEYRLKKGCHEMTLFKSDDGWEMWTRNPSTRSWNSVAPGGVSMPGIRRFSSLEEVEQHYKSWRGIAVLVASFNASPVLAA
jgi:hypothetical protein